MHKAEANTMQPPTKFIEMSTRDKQQLEFLFLEILRRVPSNLPRKDMGKMNPPSSNKTPATVGPMIYPMPFMHSMIEKRVVMPTVNSHL